MTAAPLPMLAPVRRAHGMVDPEARRQLEWLEAAVDNMAAQVAENANRLDEMEQVQFAHRPAGDEPRAP